MVKYNPAVQCVLSRNILQYNFIVKKYLLVTTQKKQIVEKDKNYRSEETGYNWNAVLNEKMLFYA